jgi:hypothetical protein
MKLMGKDIPATALVERIQGRLRTRGLHLERSGPIRFDGAEARVDPLAFNVAALDESVDPARPLGGRSLWRRVFHRTFSFFIDEAFSRQRVFNGHVRDAYAQLSADVVRLRKDMDALKPKGRRGGASKDV